uniref:Uncharacterized protein n=1 Tax=Sipha flava TaxID=143950 RepID=A0A2S2QXP8_9HEMI
MYGFRTIPFNSSCCRFYKQEARTRLTRLRRTLFLFSNRIFCTEIDNEFDSSAKKGLNPVRILNLHSNVLSFFVVGRTVYLYDSRFTTYTAKVKALKYMNLIANERRNLTVGCQPLTPKYE